MARVTSVSGDPICVCGLFPCGQLFAVGGGEAGSRTYQSSRSLFWFVVISHLTLGIWLSHKGMTCCEPHFWLWPQLCLFVMWDQIRCPAGSTRPLLQGRIRLASAGEKMVSLWFDERNMTSQQSRMLNYALFSVLSLFVLFFKD